MRITFLLVVFSLAVSSLAQEQTGLTRRILPEDIAQDSIRLVRFSTNSFGVSWSYTAAGANKMLTFNEAHRGQKVRLVVGRFESSPTEETFVPMPPTFKTYEQWKESWLKRKTDKVVGVSEDDAKKIVVGLKST